MSGIIYLLTNNINGKIYVGQTNNFKRRMKEYRVKKITKKSQNYFLMQEIVKYGFENFSMEEIDIASTREELHQKEIEWIDKLNSTDPDIGYNKKTGGSGGTMNIESIEKMRKTTSLFRHSEETKIKKSKPIIVYKDGEFSKWTSAKVFSDYIGVSRTNVTRVIKSGGTIKGYYVFYFEKELRDSIQINKPEYNKIRDTLEKGVETIETHLFVII